MANKAILVGTKFVQIEQHGMGAGLELARLPMQQSLGEQAGQMPEENLDCPKYRKRGLPVTSSQIESTVKLLNHRVKGTE